MAAAPVIGVVAGVASTAAQVSAQRAQARSQRAQVEANRLAARDNYRLSVQRFEYAKSNATQMYLRERALLDAQSQQARQELTTQQLQQQRENMARETQSRQQNAQIEAAVTQLLSQANQVRGNAALETMGIADTLGAVASDNQEQTMALQQMAALRNIDPASALIQRAQNISILDTISQLQAAVEATNTIDRVAEQQASALEFNAGQARTYGNILQDFAAAEDAIQTEYQGVVNRIMPSILSLQNQRNAVGLEASRYARQAELNIGQQSAGIQYGNQERMANAQLQGIRGPSLLGTLGSLAGNIAAPVGQLVAQNTFNAQQQQPSPWSNQTFESTSNYSQFRQPVAPYRAPQRAPMFPTILDVPSRIPVYG